MGIQKMILTLSCGIALFSCAQVQETAHVPSPAEVDSLLQVQMSHLSDSLYGTIDTSALPPNAGMPSDSDFVRLADVVPDVIQEIRYYTTFNFVGRRIPGYEAPVAWMTRRAADSIRAVSDELIKQGYRLKVFDAYRPQRAVWFFVGWSRVAGDTLMKSYFYPDVPKDSLFRQGYLSWRSAHARGSTIDLTLFDMHAEKEVDMGSPYDFLGMPSHFNYREGLSSDQIRHRRLLREVMMRHGFKPVSTEWWHFSLREEPYPTTSFDFVIQ